MNIGPVAKTLLLLLSATLALVMALSAFAYYQSTIRAPDNQFAIRTPKREEIQGAIVRLVQAGRAAELYSFYAEDGMDPIRAQFYVTMALAKHLPVSLVISVGWWEGGHMVGMADGPNVDGSYDARPGGVNSYTFKMYTLAQLEQVELNITLETQHLADSRSRMNTYEGALALYNHGSATNFDERHITYVASILRHEWELDRRFAARFADAF